MKNYIVVLIAFLLLLTLAGCQSEHDKQASAADVNEKAEKTIQKEDKRPLSERKSGDLISKKMVALADYDFETNQDIFVNVSGQLVNMNKKRNWAIIKDKDVYYYAFGHAGMEMFTQNALGKQVYIRAIVEQSPLTENQLSYVRTNGLVADTIPDNYPMDYQLNTTKFAVAENVTVEAFIGKNKL